MHRFWRVKIARYYTIFLIRGDVDMQKDLLMLQMYSSVFPRSSAAKPRMSVSQNEYWESKPWLKHACSFWCVFEFRLRINVSFLHSIGVHICRTMHSETQHCLKKLIIAIEKHSKLCKYTVKYILLTLSRRKLTRHLRILYFSINFCFKFSFISNVFNSFV